MLYAALPLTLAVVGTLAVTFVVVEVIVPALIEDHRQRRRRPVPLASAALVSAPHEETARAAVVTGDRTSGNGYEVRRRRISPKKALDPEADEDAQLHVLGDVTASEYEFDERRLRDPVPSFSSAPPNPPSQRASASPLLLFDSSEDGGGGRIEASSKPRAGGDDGAVGEETVSLAVRRDSASAANPVGSAPPVAIALATEAAPTALHACIEASPTHAAVDVPGRSTASADASAPVSTLDGSTPPSAPLSDVLRASPRYRQAKEEAVLSWSTFDAPPRFGDSSPVAAAAAASPSLNASVHSSDRNTSALDHFDWPADSDLSEGGWTRPSSPFQPVTTTTMTTTTMTRDLPPRDASVLSLASSTTTGTLPFGTAPDRGSNPPLVPTVETGIGASTETEAVDGGGTGGARMSRTVSQASTSSKFGAPPSETSDASWTRVPSSSFARSAGSASPPNSDAAAEEEDEFEYVARFDG
ncbi:hypothetical protein JCM3774_002972 [Rhodotorula dairenensis]